MNYFVYMDSNIIGGGACILGEYTTRATLDID